jgi:hypothetical protein
MILFVYMLTNTGHMCRSSKTSASGSDLQVLVGSPSSHEDELTGKALSLHSSRHSCVHEILVEVSPRHELTAQHLHICRVCTHYYKHDTLSRTRYHSREMHLIMFFEPLQTPCSKSAPTPRRTSHLIVGWYAQIHSDDSWFSGLHILLSNDLSLSLSLSCVSLMLTLCLQDGWTKPIETNNTKSCLG